MSRRRDAPGETAAGSAVPDSPLMGNGDDHASLFVPLVDIAVGIDHLLQGIRPVDDRFQLPRLDKLFDENQIFSTFLS